MNYFKSLAGIKSTVLAALLCGACLGFTACSDNNPVNPDKKMSLTVNGEHYDIALPVHEPVNLITLNTEFDADITIENIDEFQRLKIDGKEVKKGHLSLPIEIPPLHQNSASIPAILLLFSRVRLCTRGLQHARLPCPSLSPTVCSNSRPLSQ